ncbi:amidohydrolase family protein [Nocardia sp. NPDC058379]|uniref:amidohydrolase family protein n=1 Tax=unclassified Nocardia TaxID=2637762 RepID=UPI003654578F
MLITDVRPWGRSPVDIVVRGDTISEIRTSRTGLGTDDVVLEGEGRLALPTFVNAHAHVDKSWWGLPWIPSGGGDDTIDRIAYERAQRSAVPIPSVDATVGVLREFLRHGTTRVRSHVDVDLGVGLDGIHTVRAAVAALDGLVDVELVAFPQDGVIRRDGVLALLDAAAAAGADCIGGIDPATLDRDPVGQLDGIFDIADRRGVGIDIHLHDAGELGAFQLELIAERTRACGMQGQVTISHGYAIAEIGPDPRERLLDRCADAGMMWVTSAKALLPWRAMLRRGIGLGFGTDGVRDLWSPFGDGDLLRAAWTFAHLHNLRTDEDLALVIELATTQAAPFVGGPVHDLVPGARADLVLIEAENLGDVLVRVPQCRTVVAGGRIAVTDGVLA